MTKAKKVAAILLMGGEGARFGDSLPKQFHRLSGKPLYLHTVDRMLSCALFSEVILVCHADWIERVIVPDGVKVVVGGETRQDSSYLGICAAEEEIDAVVVHDAVRPLVSEKILRANVEALEKHDAIDTCVPSPDTIVYAKDPQMISAIPKRSEYLRGQTPQSFSKSLILEAHKRAQAAGVRGASDDCQLILQIDKPVHIVPGDEENLKITTPLDLYIAEQLLRQKIARQPLAEQNLRNKTFVVAGGSGGIGHAICEKLLQHGATVIPLSRSTNPYSADLRMQEKCQNIFSEIGEIDGLIHAVGTLRVKPFAELKLDEIEELIDTNFKSLIYCARYAQIRSGGDFLPIGSSSYYRGRKGYGLYSAAKAAVVNFAQSLAEERPDLNVNICLPSRTNTELRRKNFPDESTEGLLDPISVAEEVIKILRRKNSMGTWSFSK